MTLSHPTTASKRKGEEYESPVEVDAWPEEARIASLMQSGFTYAEAFHMSPRDYRRFSGIFSAWAIPRSERGDGTRKATASDIRAEFLSG